MSDKGSSTSKEPVLKRLKIDDDSKIKMKKMITANSKPLENKVDVTNMNFSQLENLPNEILLKIFTFMNPKIKELLLFGQVSRRIRSVAHDHLLWQDVNLFPKSTVPSGLLQMILENGCKRLNTCSPIVGTLTLNQESQLEFLNTAWNTDPRVLTLLLASCHSLVYLRLSNVILNRDMISSICYQNGQTLKVLKITHCKRFSGETKPEWIQGRWIQLIVDNCPELCVLDLDGTPLSDEYIELLAKNVTPKISQLRIIGIGTKCEQIKKMLESRCSNLSELKTSRSSIMYCIHTVQKFRKMNMDTNKEEHDWESSIDIISTFRRYE